MHLDPAGNLYGAIEMMKTCLSQDVDLFVLTELFTTGLLDAGDKASLELAEDRDGPTIEALRDFASSTGTYILGGSIPQSMDGVLKNTSFLIDPKGEILAEYSKAHLFGIMGEDNVFTRGDVLAAAEINGTGVGIAICYDLRFPGLIRRLAHAGCEVILVPALWPEDRIDHWKILLRARAIENQVFMVGANGIGNMHGMFFPGHSMFVSPSGEALNNPEMRESAIVRKIDISQVRNLRSRICYLDDEINISEVKWLKDVNEEGSS